MMLSVFESMENRGHEEVVFCNDKDTGLKAIIAIHNTTIGPALGGCRMWAYETDEDALKDVLRLSRGMSYKAAIAGLNLGGGKAVIIGDSKTDKNELLFRSFGRFVQGLAGRYITAEDVGTSVKDMEWVRTETRYVTGISRALGGSGDPSPVTALGTFSGIKATVKIEMERITQKEFDEIYEADIDIYAPCALGATLNDETIPKLRCSIVAGAANNQLQKEDIHAKMLKDRGILYAPDYAINAGGLINCANEIEGYNRERAFRQAEEGIYDTLMEVFKRAEAEDVTTHNAASKVAEKRMSDVAKLKNVYLPKKNVMGKRDNA